MQHLAKVIVTSIQVVFRGSLLRERLGGEGLKKLGGEGLKRLGGEGLKRNGTVARLYLDRGRQDRTVHEREGDYFGG
jgi:hypothetical protein